VRERRWSHAGKENGGTNVHLKDTRGGSFLLAVDQQIDGADSAG